jgi:hypothetical protein
VRAAASIAAVTVLTAFGGFAITAVAGDDPAGESSSGSVGRQGEDLERLLRDKLPGGPSKDELERLLRQLPPIEQPATRKPKARSEARESAPAAEAPKARLSPTL